MNDEKQSDHGISARRLVLILSGSIFVSELLIMAALNTRPALPNWAEGLLDSVLLSVLVLPVVYFFVFRPLRVQIAERHRAEQHVQQLNRFYAALSSVNQAMIHATSADALCEKICQILVEEGRFKMAAVRWLNPASQMILPKAIFGDETGYIKSINVYADDRPEGHGPSGISFREGRTYICNDFFADPITLPWRKSAQLAGFNSMISLPVRQAGQVVGIMTVYANERNFFGAHEVTLLEAAAADLSFVLDILSDTIARKRAEAQVKLQVSALNSAANAIVITNSDGVIEFVNDAFTTMTGYSREEAVGQNPRVLKSGAHPSEFYKRLWDTVKAGDVWQGELQNRRKDGTIYDEEMTITPVKDEARKITHFIAIKQNITQKKATERQLLQAQRLESIGLLAGGIAHDLNNVLAPVLMSAELLRSMELPANALLIIDTVESSARRGAEIVKQVLTFARGKPEHKGPVQFRHLVTDIVKLAKETFPRAIEISSHLPGDLWAVNGDGTQLHQVLLNLSINARDAMLAGGILSFDCINAHLDEKGVAVYPTLKPGDYIKLEVSDNGTGIPPELVDKIFEPFFTTKGQGKGTGLGLSMVMGIIRGHGGWIGVESTLGQGTKFTVLLPALPTADTRKGGDNRPALPTGHQELILIVDDEPGILTVTQALLQRQGFRTITAANGVEAISAFVQQQTEIALVITDIMMPVMDGVTLVSELRRIKPEIKCIGCSGLLEEKDTVRLEQLKVHGVKHFLIKPFAAELLLKTVAQALHESV